MAKHAAFLLIASLGVSLASQQPPTFRSAANAVLVDVRVTDQDGRFVSDLTKDDVTIFEDGREQTITTFDLVNIPIQPDTHGASTISLNTDVASNEGEVGRLYVIVLDDLHTNTLRTATVRAIAHKFVEHYMEGKDRAIVVTTKGNAGTVQQFTNNRQRLLDTIDRFQGGESLDRCGMVTTPYGIENSGDCTKREARNATQSLAGVARWLGAIPAQRKAILYISEGFRGSIGVAIPNAGFGDDAGTLDSNARADQAADDEAITFDLRELIASAARSNVSIYPVDPRGDPGAPALSGIKPVPRLSNRPNDEPDVDGRAIESDAMLRDLASATGGAALTRANDFDSLLTKMVTDTSSYYLLGYVPTNDARDGRFRRLEVRIKRPGLRVQTRTGYTAAAETPRQRAQAADLSPALRELMASPVQTAGLAMSVASPSFLGKGSKASVEVIVDVAGRDLMATSTTGGGQGTLDLLLAVADNDGHVKASERGSLMLTLSAPMRTAVADHGLRVLSRLDVPPGRYVLRVAGVDGTGTTRGSVQYDLDVPDFSKGPLAMSSLVVAASSENQRPTTGSDKGWNVRFAQPPTAQRTFPTSDEITISGEVYGRDAAPIEISTTVTGPSGTSVYSRRETVAGGSGKPAVSRYETTMSLMGFEPGSYIVRVQATASGSARPTASREVPFVVRE